ncbi:hypothetical protein [Nocardia niigatensis]|uniref:hypothetical protein n=1 Tax=Nocardia niigatensis TaxID=209249 RepID=UPI0012F67C18|nr:hypothetical protein [Nocardia niigatensis]
MAEAEISRITTDFGILSERVLVAMLDLRTLVLVAISLVVAVAAGLLTVYSGQHAAAGVLAGGGAFGVTLLFLDKVVQ